MNGRSTFGYTTWDVEDRPQIVIWEATRACALACRHCRATAQRRPGTNELTTADARGVLAQVARIRPQIFVVTGGDPLERADLFELIALAQGLGLRVSLAPSVTPLLDRQAIARLAALGCAGIQVSLDGADAATHDRFRGHPGTFTRTLQTCAWIREEGLPLTVGTTVARHNADQLAEMYELVSGLDVVRWSLFFLVPTGRARAEEMIAPEYAEAVLIWLAMISRDAPFTIKTTEAPQIRRVLAGAGRPEPDAGSAGREAPESELRLDAAGRSRAVAEAKLGSDAPGWRQAEAEPRLDGARRREPEPRSGGGEAGVRGAWMGRDAASRRGEAPEARWGLRRPDGASQGEASAQPLRSAQATIADGRGFMFIAANGDICPSGFLPLAAGNTRTDDILQVYRTHPLFQALRNPDALTGPRCRRCAYRRVCGGSRSRAYAVAGDPLGDDPLCVYEPPSTLAETRDAPC